MFYIKLHCSPQEENFNHVHSKFILGVKFGWEDLDSKILNFDICPLMGLPG